MMSDGIKDHKKEESMVPLDIAEIIWKAMDMEPAKAEAEAAETA